MLYIMIVTCKQKIQNEDKNKVNLSNYFNKYGKKSDSK